MREATASIFPKAQRVLPAFEPAWTARTGAEELYEAYQRHRIDQATLFGSAVHAAGADS